MKMPTEARLNGAVKVMRIAKRIEVKELLSPKYLYLV
jgi:hypothetical protein